MNNNQIINPFFELGRIISHIIRECYHIEIQLRDSLSFGTFYKLHKFVIGPGVDDDAATTLVIATILIPFSLKLIYKVYF